MAQLHPKDKPTYYNVVGSVSGAVLATAPASKILKVHKQLQAQYNTEKLEIVLVVEN